MIQCLHTIKEDFINLYKQEYFYSTGDTELREVTKIFNLLIKEYENKQTN